MSTNDIKNIGDWVIHCCSHGLLYPVEPLVPSAIKRHLFVTPEIKKMLDGPWVDKTAEEEWGSARAVMDAFVSGSLISISKNKYGSKPHHHMGFLDPEKRGIWDFRATKPSPGIRILGQFAEKDFFIALTWEKRLLLGVYMSAWWVFYQQHCEYMWRKIFYTFVPLKGGVYDDYLSSIIVK